MKRLFLVIPLVFILMFSSCTLNKSEKSDFEMGEVINRFLDKFIETDEEKENKKMECLLDALKNGDREALKSVFSTKALAESENFDDSMEYLFSFFQGNVDSWQKDNKGPITDIAKNREGRMVEIKSWYVVNTDSQKYLFFLLDYPIDTYDPDNVGLYSLRVIKAEDEETEFGNWQDMKTPGIYKPEIVID